MGSVDSADFQHISEGVLKNNMYFQGITFIFIKKSVIYYYIYCCLGGGGVRPRTPCKSITAQTI